jgi:hypothetical protein
MESPLSICRMHWDHEPSSKVLLINNGLRRRFMESPQSQKVVAHWDHEPSSKFLLITNGLRRRFMERESRAVSRYRQ